MTRDEAETFFARRQKIWATRDVGELAKGHTEDGAVESPMLGPLKGREAIAKSYEALFRAFSEFQFVGESLVVDGDRIAQPFTATATHTGDFMGLSGTGRHAQFHGVMLYEMKDGLIAHERRVYDFTGLLLQIGVLRGKPAK